MAVFYIYFHNYPLTAGKITKALYHGKITDFTVNYSQKHTVRYHIAVSFERQHQPARCAVVRSARV